MDEYDRVTARVFAAFQSMGCPDGPVAPDDIEDQAAVAGVVAKWLVDDGVRYRPHDIRQRTQDAPMTGPVP